MKRLMFWLVCTQAGRTAGTAVKGGAFGVTMACILTAPKIGIPFAAAGISQTVGWWICCGAMTITSIVLDYWFGWRRTLAAEQAAEYLEMVEAAKYPAWQNQLAVRAARDAGFPVHER